MQNKTGKRVFRASVATATYAAMLSSAHAHGRNELKFTPGEFQELVAEFAAALGAKNGSTDGTIQREDVQDSVRRYLLVSDSSNTQR